MRKLLLVCVVMCLGSSVCKAGEALVETATFSEKISPEFAELVKEQEPKYDVEYYEKRRESKIIASQNLEFAVYQFVIDELIQACHEITGENHGGIYLESKRFNKRIIINECNIENIGD